jgi:hypothetical protein
MAKQLTKKEITHIKEYAEKSTRKAKEGKLWECGDKNYSLHLFYFDFTDAEIDASVKLMSRFVHQDKHGEVSQLFSHLVGEQVRRQTDKDFFDKNEIIKP